MAWSLEGDWIESCSCAMVCPCNFGPEGKPDEGWCSAGIGLKITRGTSEGVDLSNTQAAFVADFPGNFLLGNGTMQVFLDDGLSPDQQRELEAILTGKKGGVPGGLADAMSQILPVKLARVALETGDEPMVSIAGVGEARLQPIKDANGASTQIVNYPVGTGFAMPSMDLAFTQGRWSVPQLRTWQPGGNGGVARFSWSG